MTGTQRFAMVVVGICILLGFAGAVGLGGERFYQAYLFAFVFWLGLPLGALTFAMIHPLVGGSWGVAIRPVLLAAVRTLPVLGLLFVPLAFGMGHLYPWAIPGGLGGPESLHGPFHGSFSGAFSGYFSRPFFLGRAVCYFVVWILLAWPIVRWTEGQWPLGKDAPYRLRALCAAGLVLHLFVDSLAAVDWVMSLEPDYYSTDFALIFMAGQALLAFAFTLAAGTWLRARNVLPDGPYLKERRLTYRDLGSLLAVCVLLWAYLEYAQLIINWSGDTTREAGWYLHRSQGGWQVVAGLLVALNFGAPFFALLFRKVKDAPRYLAWVAFALIVMHVLDSFWLVVPSFGAAFRVHWQDVAAWSGMGVLWLMAFTVALPRLKGLAVAAREGGIP
jgi:hypothetical protein